MNKTAWEEDVLGKGKRPSEDSRGIAKLKAWLEKGFPPNRKKAHSPNQGRDVKGNTFQQVG